MIAAAGWSPDGRRLAYVRVRRGRARLVVARADGSRARAIAGAGRGPVRSGLAWTPHGQRITFADAAGLVSVPFGGGATGGRRRLFAGGRDPSWAPSGRRMVFTAGGDLRISALTGRGSRSLLAGVAGAPPGVTGADYAPDGRRVLFTADGALYTFFFDRASVQRISPAGLPAPSGGAWSPDGRRIVFVVRHGGTRDGLYVAMPDGSRPHRLLAGHDLRRPSWDARVSDG